MTDWHHCTQTVEISTFCRPPRSRAPRLVKEDVAIPIRIRRLPDTQAPLAVRLDRDAMTARRTYRYGQHGSSILSNLMNVGSEQTGITEFRSSPEGFLCIGTTYAGGDPWAKLTVPALVEIGKDPGVPTGGYSGPEGAKDVEWSTFDAAVRTLQRMADALFLVGDRLFAPCDVPLLVREPENQAGTPAWIWSVSNGLAQPKSDHVYLSLPDAARDLPDFASCVEIVDARLLPGIGASLAKAVAYGLSNPSYGEVVLAAKVLEAVGAGAVAPRPVDWDALRTSLEALRDLRSHFRIPNEASRIVLGLPEEALMPAPGIEPAEEPRDGTDHAAVYAM